MNASGTTIDLVTALGRLLSDGHLRESFRLDPKAVAAELGLRESDQPALERMAAEELEIQAGILLRKRFNAVRSLLGETCGHLGERAWPLFREYSREKWPASENSACSDSEQFMRWLEQRQFPVLARERNRIEFELENKSVRLHWIQADSRPRRRSALQLLFRIPKNQFHEIVFRMALSEHKH